MIIDQRHGFTIEAQILQQHWVVYDDTGASQVILKNGPVFYLLQRLIDNEPIETDNRNTHG